MIASKKIDRRQVAKYSQTVVYIDSDYPVEIQ